MTPLSREAKSQYQGVKSMFDEMETLYQDLETYFAFDKKQYPLHSLMKDIKTFKDQFKVKGINKIFLSFQTSSLY